MIKQRQRDLLQLIWRHGPLSRSQLYDQTHIRLNTIGEMTNELIDAGILRERDNGGQSRGRGRPPVPLEIDPAQRHVLGIALLRHQVQVARINLMGEQIEVPAVCEVSENESIMAIAADLLREHLHKNTLSIGVTTPGLIDLDKRQVVLSPSVQDDDGNSLDPIFDAAGDTPIAIDNDAHGLAAHWALLHANSDLSDDLLVLLGDGQLGSSLLIEGKPNAGSINGANELGHTRMPVETARCYCGHIGCLERIASSEFLGCPIDDAVASYTRTDDSMNHMINLLAMGIANAVNFTRIGRLVLASSWMAHQAFAQALTSRIRAYVLDQLEQRLTIEPWERPSTEPTTTAGGLALAHLFCPRWESQLIFSQPLAV